MDEDLERLLYLHRMWKDNEPCIPIRIQQEYNELYNKKEKT